MKTDRGFELIKFQDDYGVDCTLQESSSWEPHVWLGVDRPEASVMYKDLENYEFLVQLDPTNSDGTGWCEYPIPKQVLIASRMHLNQEQAKKLAEYLNYFAEYGTLPDSTEGEI